MKRSVLLLTVIAVSICRSASASAADTATEFGLSASLELMHFHYRETDLSGEELNREEGVLPGIGLQLQMKKGPWFTQLGGSMHRGHVDYDGQTQTGNPVTTRTRTELYSIALQAGRRLGGGDRSHWSPFVRLSGQWWDRDIQSTANVQGLFETYQWNEAGAGLQYRWNKAGGNAWGHRLSGEIFRTFDIEVLARLSALQGSNFDDVTLHPENAMGTRLRYSASKVLDDGTVLFIEPWVALWEFDRSGTIAATSNGSPTGTRVTEPQSESRRIGVRIRLGF